MKLLFDENLSHRLAASVAREFPGTRHVRDVGLRGASDRRVWDFARENGFVVVSKDGDFRQLSFVAGAPPKVVWLDVGNDGTAAIREWIGRSQLALRTFHDDATTALLILSRARGGS